MAPTSPPSFPPPCKSSTKVRLVTYLGHPSTKLYPEDAGALSATGHRVEEGGEEGEGEGGEGGGEGGEASLQSNKTTSLGSGWKGLAMKDSKRASLDAYGTFFGNI